MMVVLEQSLRLWTQNGRGPTTALLGGYSSLYDASSATAGFHSLRI